MNTRGWLFRVRVIVLVVVLGAVARGTWRYWTITRLLRNANEHRLQIEPLEKQIPLFNDPATTISLGYARASLATQGKVDLWSLGDGTWIAFTNATVKGHFTTPFESHVFASLTDADLKLTEKISNRHPHSAQLLRQLQTSVLEAFWEIEQTRVEPIWRLFVMSNDEWTTYLMKLASKLSLSRLGHDEVYYFRSPRIKGLVWVGYAKGDNRNALAKLASLDDKRNAWLTITLPLTSSLAAETVLRPILGSFHFESVPLTNRTEIAKLIADAGIPRRPAESANEN